jgi:hypothetical protein
MGRYAMLTAEQKLVYEQQIRNLNKDFDQDGFQLFFVDFAKILQTKRMFAFEIENWLHDLQAKEDLPIIWGILAWLNIMNGDTVGAVEHAREAKKHFPKCDLWQTFIDSSPAIDLAEELSQERKRPI